MASVGIDDIIGHLNTLKQQEVQLKLKDEKIKKYEDLLLNYKSTRFDDCFLIYSYDEDQENIEIITKYFMEFTELAYEHHYLLIARKEVNRNVAIYLMAFDDDCQLDSTIDDIDLLIDSKRKQQEEESNRLPINREMKIMNKILMEKVEEYEKKVKEQENQLKEYVKKTENFELKIVEQTKKIQESEQKLKKMEKDNEEQMRKLLELFSENIGLNRFLNQKNLEMIKNSIVVIDGIGKRLCKKEKGDSDRYEPPLETIDSLERIRREVFDFIEFIRINWNNTYSATNIQRNILDWLFNNSHQFLYNSSEVKKEKSRKMFLNKFKLKNTIGTIHFLPIQFNICSRCYCLAISNYRIVFWSWNYSQQNAYDDIYYRLKQLPTWTENSKFATEMEVNDAQSDTFIHTLHKDVFVENEKVVTWMKNNFDFEQQNNGSSYGVYNIPSFCNFFVNFYDTSFTG